MGLPQMVPPLLGSRGRRPNGSQESCLVRGDVMRFRFSRSFLLVALLISLALPVAAQLQTPEQFAGFRMGTEGKVVRWEKIVEDLQKVDAASDRVVGQEPGKSGRG